MEVNRRGFKLANEDNVVFAHTDNVVLVCVREHIEDYIVGGGFAVCVEFEKEHYARNV